MLGLLPGFGDVGSEEIPNGITASNPLGTRPATGVTLDTSGCNSAWMNNSVTNAPGPDHSCLVDYATGEVIQVDPTTGQDALGRPFWCHMPSVSGYNPVLAWPKICGTPAQQAAAAAAPPPDHGPMSFFTAPPATMNAAADAAAAAEFAPPGTTPPPLPIPILQQIQNAIQGGVQISTPQTAIQNTSGSGLPAGIQLSSTPAAADTTPVSTPVSSSPTMWVALAALGLLGLKYL